MMTARVEEMDRLRMEGLIVQEPLQIGLMTAETLKVKAVSGTGEVIILLQESNVVFASNHELR